MFQRILIVCVGNICRSPTAEHLLRQALLGTDVQVSSAGLGALVDKPIERNALATLQQHGKQPHEHSARQLTSRMLRESDLVLVMEKRHLQGVSQIAPEARGKTFLLGKWQDDREIPDPYRQSEAAFEHAYALIKEGVDAWSKRIRPNR
ncbi:Low molecular weight protein-tyrosine-phosphatase etp [compost metagenome]